MTDVYSEVRAILRGTIQILGPTIEYSWENVGYKPKDDVPYVKEQLSGLDAPQVSLGTDGLIRDEFIYFLTLNYPAEGTDALVIDRTADQFRQILRANTPLVGNLFKGYITKAIRNTYVRDGKWMMLPLQFNGYVNSRNNS